MELLVNPTLENLKLGSILKRNFGQEPQIKIANWNTQPSSKYPKAHLARDHFLNTNDYRQLVSC